MPLDITKVYRVTDEATAGKWFDVGNGARLKVAKGGNERHENVLKRLRRPYRNMRNVPDDVVDKITIQAMAEAILVDWEGIEENSKAVKCTAEKRVEYLTSYPDFKEQVANISMNFRNFAADEEHDEKN